MKLFVTSASIKKKNIKNIIDHFLENGFQNIEFSGGSYLNENIYELLKHKSELEIVFHNYFPVPKKNFVLNLASIDDDIFKKSINLCMNSINISKKLGLKRYSVHAGFFLDFTEREIGNSIHYKKINNKELALDRFVKAWEILKKEADNKIDLYIENNVLSLKNYNNLKSKKPFMLIDSNDYNELKKRIDFKLLLDVAHLKVSANSLNINYLEEFDYLFDQSDYIHYSENNGIKDINKGLSYSKEIFKILSKKNLTNKIITLEIYDQINEIKDTYNQFLTL